jgi:GntR family transcriptional regulator
MSGESVSEDTAKYLVIADELRTRIISGAVAPGARLPGENELIRRHGVARMTARQALSVLQAEGLTVARKGAGVFVRDFRPVRRRVWDRSRPPGLPAADRDGASLGRAPAPVTAVPRSPFPTRVDGRAPALDEVQVFPDAASPVVAGALGVEPGSSVWVRTRRFALDGKPVMISVSYLPGDLVAGSPITEQDPGPGGTEARLAELGHPPARITEELRARMPMRYEAADLKLPPGTAVIVLCRTAFDPAGRPVEFTKMTMDADAFVLEYGLNA